MTTAFVRVRPADGVVIEKGATDDAAFAHMLGQPGGDEYYAIPPGLTVDRGDALDPVTMTVTPAAPPSESSE